MRRFWRTSSSTRSVHDQEPKLGLFSHGMPLPVLADTPPAPFFPQLEQLEEIPVAAWKAMVVAFEHQRGKHQEAFVRQEQEFLRPDRDRALRHRRLLEDAIAQSHALTLEMERKWASAMQDLNGRADRSLQAYSVRLGELGSEFVSLVERTVQECTEMARIEIQQRLVMEETVLLEAEARSNSPRVPRAIPDAAPDYESDPAHSSDSYVSPMPPTGYYRTTERQRSHSPARTPDIPTVAPNRPFAGLIPVPSTRHFESFFTAFHADEQNRAAIFAEAQKAMDVRLATWRSATTDHQLTVEETLAKCLHDLGTREDFALRWHAAERSTQDLVTFNTHTLRKNLATVLADTTIKLQRPITVNIAVQSNSSVVSVAYRECRPGRRGSEDLDFERLVRDRRRSR